MHKIIFFILLFSPLSMVAQVPNQTGARASGLSNATLLLSDVWSVKNNVGAIGSLDKTEVGLAYQSRFLLKEFSNQSIVCNYASNYGSFGVYFQQSGFSFHRQIVTGLGYGMKLSEKISTGISLNYERIGFGDIYGSTGGVSMSLGMLYRLNDNIDLGFNVANLNRAKITDLQDERFPTVFNLGAKYNFSEGTFWSFEVEKDLLHKVNFKSGIEIEAHDVFVVRLGMNSYPFQSSLGVGLKVKGWRLDLATSWHTNLGINPTAGIVYQFK